MLTKDSSIIRRPIKLDEFNVPKEPYGEINKDSLLEKVILLGICYFSLSTELRLIDESLCKFNVESERIHAKAVEIACMYLPPTCPLVEHVSNSYLKYHSPIVAIVSALSGKRKTKSRRKIQW